MEEKKRYSDEELAEFRELINEKLRVAKGQYEEVMATLNKRNSNDIEDTLPTYHALEEGSTVQSLEELMNSAERLRKFITGLQAALVRIENKTYGICRVTKQLIPKERLRAVPHATLSIEAKLAQGKSGRRSGFDPHRRVCSRTFDAPVAKPPHLKARRPIAASGFRAPAPRFRHAARQVVLQHPCRAAWCPLPPSHLSQKHYETSRLSGHPPLFVYCGR